MQPKPDGTISRDRKTGIRLQNRSNLRAKLTDIPLLVVKHTGFDEMAVVKGDMSAQEPVHRRPRGTLWLL